MVYGQGFSINEAQQRMRWIRPGTFMMGSPESEEGRIEHEGPQHEVEISEGFWLFDMPCTQALWQAVMANNPSQFSDNAENPVEQVSWQDVQEFIKNINQIVPDLNLTLSTEAQWEYACRAGTTTATYAGDLSIKNYKAKQLEEIAWYRGNSNSSTHKVGTKLANDWGLYDMLGNVWEWCKDGARTYSEDSEVDPKGPMKEAGARVLRGGSWNLSARYVRAALRLANSPDYRVDDFGFRCARVQDA